MKISKECAMIYKEDTTINNTPFRVYTLNDIDSGHNFNIYCKTADTELEKMALFERKKIDFDFVIDKKGAFKLKRGVKDVG